MTDNLISDRCVTRQHATAPMGDEGKGVRRGGAGGFAVCGVRPQDKDDSTAEERHQQREAEIVFCPVH
jgi:hypothetical protein